MPSSNTHTIRIPKEKRDQLRKVVKRFNRAQKPNKVDLKQPDILATLIDMADKHDLLRPDWQTRLNAALIAGDREIESSKYHEDPNRCPAIAKGAKKYKCIWGRKEKTPEVRVLEEFYEASKELCSSCKITLAIKAETAGLREDVAELKTKLKKRGEMVYRIPVCKAVGLLNKDATIFTRCQERDGHAVNIEEVCKIKNNGSPCRWYEESIVGVGEKIKRRD